MLNATTMDCFAYDYSIWTHYGPKSDDGDNPYFTVADFDRFIIEFFKKRLNCNS